MDQLSRSITINGRRTSIRMERSLWLALTDVAVRENCRLRDLIGMVDQIRGDFGLTAAIRVFVVNYLRQASQGSTNLDDLPRATRKRMPTPDSPAVKKALAGIQAPPG